jgi:thioredoxin reductase (NADPH)
MNVLTGAEDVLATDGVFVYIGHDPNTGYLGDLVSLRESGYIDVRDEVYTDVSGLFAAGDVADETYRQLGTSIGAGTRAAMTAERWLAEQGWQTIGHDGVSDATADPDGSSTATAVTGPLFIG